MSSMPQLSNDVLQIISEKLLFKKPLDEEMYRKDRRPDSKQMDLRLLTGYTLFMYHSAKNMQAFLSNFTKIKVLEFFTCGEFRIDLYKDKVLPWDVKKKNNNFTGPYSVSKQLFLDLQRAGFLRISNIQINECLYDFADETFEHLENMKALHTPSTSSLINISNLHVYEYAGTFQKHLATLLSINAENIEFDIHKNLIFECSSSNEPPIVNERTKKIVTKCRLEMESMNYFLDHFKNYKDFLLLCCPNLEYMEFEFTNYVNFYLEEVENSSNDYLTKLEVIIVPIIEDLKLLHRGSEHLKIRIEFTAKFSIREEFESISNEHTIFTLGDEFVIDKLSDEYSSYIARNIKFSDSIGRQHECLFQIFCENPYYNYGYDDFNADDFPCTFSADDFTFNSDDFPCTFNSNDFTYTYDYTYD